MAQYRLEMQAIKRREGRSVVAAAAYRSATKLHDARLEMTFDYAAKGGVAAKGVMAPDGTPADLLDRERLWNAAEAADRRVDSRTAREILISLPHELTDAQRHDLVRAFAAEVLVAKGMIVDYAIHRPDAHGDPRNHHAHILVTTRAVGPEGFGFKQRAWDSPDAVAEVRAAWAEIQNRHLRQHLGPEAPQVSHLSLAGQGIEREPTVHLGPSASGMERRGETSDRGDVNRRIEARNEAREATTAELRALEDRLAETLPRRAYPIEAVIREFEAIHQTMVRQRDEWRRGLALSVAPDPPSARSIMAEVLGETPSARARAAWRLARTEQRVATGRARRAGLDRWIRNPARMIWARHAELNAVVRAREALAAAEAAVTVRRDWLSSLDGRAYVAGRLDPVKQAVEDARRTARTLERKIKRADKRIEALVRTRTKLLVARELGHSQMTAPSQMRLGVEQAVREVDRRVEDVVRGHPVPARRAALTKVLKRLASPTLGWDLEL